MKVGDRVKNCFCVGAILEQNNGHAKQLSRETVEGKCKKCNKKGGKFSWCYGLINNEFWYSINWNGLS